ncbi:MAG: hypothetical protein PHO02_04200 [Candidatus Nanoarchaeia archaeon]|nr:hypothetical protein [Candidatus Nanoarchaeia archaeon]
MISPKCINCGVKILKGNSCNIISKNKDREFICKLCSKFTKSTLRLHEVAIIPITKERFESIVQKYRVYYHPMKYTRKGGKFLAFYVTSPISAITCYGKVQKININQPLRNLPGAELFNSPYDELQKVYFLEWIKEIRHIKKKDKRTIQGTILTTLKDLKKAENIAELIKK